MFFKIPDQSIRFSVAVWTVRIWDSKLIPRKGAHFILRPASGVPQGDGLRPEQCLEAPVPSVGPGERRAGSCGPVFPPQPCPCHVPRALHRGVCASQQTWSPPPSLTLSVGLPTAGAPGGPWWAHGRPQVILTTCVPAWGIPLGFQNQRGWLLFCLHEGEG